MKIKENHNYGVDDGGFANGLVRWGDPVVINVCDGLLHSYDDEPAIVTNSSSYWYKNGRLHREGDKPAMDFNNHNLKSWWINDKRHRLDKPAVIGGVGDDELWVDGDRYRDENFFKLACRKYKLNNIINGKNSL